jgi:hypothetical protein
MWIDRAVDLLNEREHSQYGAIVARLRAAGRDDEVVDWIDRAVADGRVSSQGGGNDYWLSPSDVAETYRGIGRIDDAIAVLRADFVRQPAVHSYRALLDFAATIDRADTERAWALGHARELADGPGAGSSWSSSHWAREIWTPGGRPRTAMGPAGHGRNSRREVPRLGRQPLQICTGRS